MRRTTALFAGLFLAAGAFGPLAIFPAAAQQAVGVTLTASYLYSVKACNGTRCQTRTARVTKRVYFGNADQAVEDSRAGPTGRETLSWTRVPGGFAVNTTAGRATVRTVFLVRGNSCDIAGVSAKVRGSRSKLTATTSQLRCRVVPRRSTTSA